MDDTLLDGHTAMTASWSIVCAEAATAMGGDAERLRDAIRRESIEFWKDESVSGHWRVKLDDARAFVLERALLSEGLDGSSARQLSAQYADLHRQHSVLFDDAIETLELLRDRGMKLGLLTNGAHDPQWEKINRFDLARHFDVIVVEGEFGRGKPEPDVFRHALATVGAPRTKPGTLATISTPTSAARRALASPPPGSIATGSAALNPNTPNPTPPSRTSKNSYLCWASGQSVSGGRHTGLKQATSRPSSVKSNSGAGSLRHTVSAL